MSVLLEAAVAQIGKLHDGPDVVRLAQEIAQQRPQEASYWADANNQTSWCGVFQAWNLLKNGYSLPKSPGPDGTGAMWVNWWLDYGTEVPIGQEQPGDLALWLGSPHHISMVAGGGQYVGGNQSDGVTRTHFRTPDAIRRPPAISKPISTAPAKQFVLDPATINKIAAAAKASELAQWNWGGRGHAPTGFIQGMAVSYAQALQHLAASDSISQAMVRVVDSPTEHDVFDQYEETFATLGMTFEAPDIDRLRLLWVVLTGLAMRESSGGQDIGRDQSASNVSADTAEAGTWQQSWDSRVASPELPKLLEAYRGTQPDAVDAIFKQGITLRPGALESFGDGDGRTFQDLAKARPSFAVQCAAIGLRTLCTHWGPIIRREAEIVPAADALFKQVQTIVEGAQPVVDPIVVPVTPTPTTDVHPEIKIGAVGPAVVELQKLLGIAPQTGFFDNSTDSAVRAFQASHNLDVDGEVGEQTWMVLIDPSKAPKPPEQLPVLTSSFDLAKFVEFILNHKDEAYKILTTGLAIFNTVHPGKPIVLPPFVSGLFGPTGSTTPVPTDTPISQRPSVQLGGLALVGTTLAQIFGGIGPPVPLGGLEATLPGILSTVLPIATMALGGLGIWGKVGGAVLNMVAPLVEKAVAAARAKAAADAQTPQK